MNVIFLDFDGVLNTDHYGTLEDVERRIIILADICREYNCKVVIEASAKDAIDEETMEIYEEAETLRKYFDLFNKYGIEVIGRTPNVKRRTGETSYLPMWKEDEIRLYLKRHPEIEHYCVIDDNDTVNTFHWNMSDLEKVKDHLVETICYSKHNPEKEGLLQEHKELVGKVLEEENEIRKLVLRKKERNR